MREKPRLLWYSTNSAVCRELPTSAQMTATGSVWFLAYSAAMVSAERVSCTGALTTPAVKVASSSAAGGAPVSSSATLTSPSVSSPLTTSISAKGVFERSATSRTCAL